MTAKKSKTGPDKWRKYDDAFKAEALRLASDDRSTQAAAQQLGISPELLYRWQQAQRVAEVACDPKVRARLERAEQELDILKKTGSSLASLCGERLPAHRPTPSSSASFARCWAWPPAPIMRGSGASHPFQRQLGK